MHINSNNNLAKKCLEEKEHSDRSAGLIANTDQKPPQVWVNGILRIKVLSKGAAGTEHEEG